VKPEEVDYVLAHVESTDISRSTGKPIAFGPIAFGHTASGRYLAVIYDPLDELCVFPITAYDVEE